MKKLLLLAFIFLGGNVFAQNRANIWEIGFQDFPKKYPQCGINFNSGIADSFSVLRHMVTYVTDASICDTAGQLLFYTNGVYIANRKNDSLKNSTNFNPGYFTNFYRNQGLGFPQGAIVIPEPGRSSKYLIFYITCELFNAYGQAQAQPLHLSVSEIDMKLNAGLGGISTNKKNIHVIEDTLSQGRIMACKNANGRDWWIIIHKFYSDIYYKVLVTPDTMLVTSQAIGNKFTSNDLNGMAVFSPDGSQYAQLNINDTIDLLQFNRCTGEFSNPQSLIIPDTGFLSASIGCAFSPNSRYLYASSYLRLYQFDTWGQDINSSRILIDTIPWHQSFEWFFLYQLGPDGKIYISTFNSDCPNPRLHYIDQPDSSGKACDFRFDGFVLPDSICNHVVPNFPNYDLGPLAGSSCDTVITSFPSANQSAFTHDIYPNPCTGKFQLNITGVASKTQVVIYNEMGEVVGQTTLQPVNGFIHGFFNLQNEPSGVYFLKAETDRGEVAEKILKE